MNDQTTFLITSAAGQAVEKILKSLAKGAIHHLGREAVEEIVRDVLRESSPQSITYSPTIITMTVDEVYANMGSDSRFQVTKEYTVALTPSQPPFDDDVRRQITRAEVKYLQDLVKAKQLHKKE